MENTLEQFHELSFYTLSHGDPKFIHQHAVDAFAVQTAGDHTKAISLIFGLAGLYLLIEKKFTGREVQQMHVLMSQHKKPWPQIEFPKYRGEITVAEVVAAPAGPERDAMIYHWCHSVWQAFAEDRDTMIEWMSSYLDRWKSPRKK